MLHHASPWIVAGLCAVFLSAGTARADLVTPGSISPAPADWVTDQYKRLGLVFAPPSWAGVVYGWTSLTTWPGQTSPWEGVPAGFVSVQFVVPGTGAPAMTDSVRVRLYSTFDAGISLEGYDMAGKSLGSRDVLVESTSDGWLTLHAPGMHQLDIVSGWPPGTRFSMNSPNFDVEAIEFHPVATLPEPGGLALFGLGTLTLVGGSRAWRAQGRRHNRRVLSKLLEST
jgi:hypothetical protein